LTFVTLTHDNLIKSDKTNNQLSNDNTWHKHNIFNFNKKIKIKIILYFPTMSKDHKIIHNHVHFIAIILPKKWEKNPM
jgi:hypothetical protein